MANLLPWVIGTACVLIGWQIKGVAESADEAIQQTNNRSGRHRSAISLVGNGSQLIAGWNVRLREAADTGMEDLAAALLVGSHRQDLALWAPLLARWSATDGPGMIAFVEKIPTAALRPRLLEYAWFAWGASDPDAAFEAGRKLSPVLVKKLLEGIAETDPAKAAEYAVKVPNSQFAMGNIAARIVETSPEIAQSLLERAVYDGGRYPFEKARISQLAATDPGGAVAYARSLGVIGFDPVPGAVEAIAKNDPVQAAAEVAAMPTSRSKALSSVALAECWAARDREAAVKWMRGSLSGPVLHDALIAAASASGRDDPAGALDLVREAGWEKSSNFFSIRDSGTMTAGESRDVPNARVTTIDLLQQWARKDPAAARQYLAEKIPDGVRQELSSAAGITP